MELAGNRTPTASNTPAYPPDVFPLGHESLVKSLVGVGWGGGRGMVAEGWGGEFLDQWIVVVPAVDQHFRTIPDDRTNPSVTFTTIGACAS